MTLYSEVEASPIHWLWYPYIAIGKITLLQGDPGDGKSTMMMNLIAEITTGGAFPDGKPLVSVIALVQTHIYAKKQNSRDLAVRKKQIQPIFSVEIIDIDQQLPGTTEAVGLYSSSNFPKHRNVHIRIENVAELPIRNVIIFDRYYFQLLKPNEPKDIYVVYSDSPDAGTKVAVIARILETEYERTERGIPKWFNINFEDVDGNESFQTFTLENFEGVQYYSLKSTEEI